MGYRSSSQEFGEQGGVRGADGRSDAAAEEIVNTYRSVESRHPSEHSWGVRVALFALSFYKSYLSILMAGNCRFQPTCSRYAYEAVERFGVARGTWLAIKRLSRCHPLSRKFGYDPVPEKDQAMSSKSVGCENCGAHL